MMNMQTSAITLVIFGASGDLTQRKLVPALHSLDCEQRLPEELTVLGVGRTDLSDAQFRDQLKQAAKEHARLKPVEWEGFEQRLSYLSGGYDDPETYEGIKEYGRGNLIFYMAVPPSVVPTIVHRLGESGLNQSASGWRRIVVEKPFGRDQESAQELNTILHDVFKEKQIYRIDHYLGKETVQNILALRFANAIFEPLWNLKYIDHVQIIVAEGIGVGYRGEYYDQAGVLRDIFQNHLLQLLTLIAIEPPALWKADALRDEKVKLLQSVRPIERSMRAQYGGSDETNSYLEEQGVAPDSETATFAAIRLCIDNWRWRGVPFYLQSGKRLKAKTTAIVIEFKSVPHLLFSPSQRKEITPNLLALCIQPNEGMKLGIQAKKPGAGMDTRSVDIDYQYAQVFGQQALPEAYERLLLDVIQGDPSLFARADEIELDWSIIDPILETWEGPDAPPLHSYRPGTWGPDQADQFIQQDGRHWYYPCT
jgi:glucose-6-phosphate 1-dehydrogenase